MSVLSCRWRFAKRCSMPCWRGRQPVHGGVQFILVDGPQRQQVAEGGDGAFRVQAACGGEFGASVDDASDDHGDDEIALAGGGTSDEGMEAELVEGTEDGGDMAVGVATNHGEQFVGGTESDTAFEEDTQALNDVIGALGEVGDGTFLTLPCVSPFCYLSFVRSIFVTTRRCQSAPNARPKSGGRRNV